MSVKRVYEWVFGKTRSGNPIGFTIVGVHRIEELNPKAAVPLVRVSFIDNREDIVLRCSIEELQYAMKLDKESVPFLTTNDGEGIDGTN